MPTATATFGKISLSFLACVSDQGFPVKTRTSEIEELTTPGVDGSNFRRVRYADATWNFTGYSDALTFSAAVDLAQTARAIDGNRVVFAGTFGGLAVTIPAAVLRLISVRPTPGAATGAGASGAAHLVSVWNMTILGAFP